MYYYYGDQVKPVNYGGQQVILARPFYQGKIILPGTKFICRETVYGTIDLVGTNRVLHDIPPDTIFEYCSLG